MDPRSVERQNVMRGLFGIAADPQVATRAPWIGGMAVAAGLATPVIDNFIIQPAQNLWEFAKTANSEGYGALPITAPAEMVADAATPGWTHGALGTLKEGLNPSFLAANFGGKRHERFLPNLWHGVKNEDMVDHVVDKGFQRGRSAELGLEGTSVTPDPKVAYNFGNTTKDSVLRVDTEVKPEEVFNLRPSHYLAANAPTDVPLLRKPQSYFSEAEYWIPGASREKFFPRKMFSGNNSRNNEETQFAAYVGMKEFPTGLQRAWRLKELGYGTPKQQGNYKDLARDIASDDTTYQLGSAERAFAKKFYPWMVETEAKVAPIARELSIIQSEMYKIKPKIEKKKKAIFNISEHKDEYGNSHGIPAENAQRFDDLYRRKNQLAEELRKTIAGIQIPSGAALRAAENNLRDFVVLYFRSGRDDVLEETLSVSQTPQDAIKLYKKFVRSTNVKKTSKPSMNYINGPEEIKPQSKFTPTPAQYQLNLANELWAKAEGYDLLPPWYEGGALTQNAHDMVMLYLQGKGHKSQGPKWEESTSLSDTIPF